MHYEMGWNIKHVRFFFTLSPPAAATRVLTDSYIYANLFVKIVTG